MPEVEDRRCGGSKSLVADRREAWMKSRREEIDKGTGRTHAIDTQAAGLAAVPYDSFCVSMAKGRPSV